MLFTSPINKDQIDPKYPWYLQEAIDAEADVTVFICGSDLFCFSRSRKDLIGLDWRTTDNRNPTVDEWTPRRLGSSEEGAIAQFCAELGVTWGRIDLLEANGELLFLEYNANGQWVFLDYSNKVGLMKKVLDYLTQTACPK